MTAILTDAPPIGLSESAVKQVNKILARQAEQGRTNMGLRLGVRGGGCSGLNYEIDLDSLENVDAGLDQTFDVDGVRVIVDARSLPYLKGSTLEFTGDLMSGGFQFNNPNAARTCGCGTSFTPA